MAGSNEEIMREALEEITLGRGPYKLDPLEHAGATIEEMKKVAKEALEKCNG